MCRETPLATLKTCTAPEISAKAPISNARQGGFLNSPVNDHERPEFTSLGSFSAVPQTWWSVVRSLLASLPSAAGFWLILPPLLLFPLGWVRNTHSQALGSSLPSTPAQPVPTLAKWEERFRPSTNNLFHNNSEICSHFKTGSRNYSRATAPKPKWK